MFIVTICTLNLLRKIEGKRGHYSEGSYLTSLCQAHAYSEAGRHAWRKWCRQRAAQAWIDHQDTFDNRLHYQLTAEPFDTVNLLTCLSVGQTKKKLSITQILMQVHKLCASNEKHVTYDHRMGWYSQRYMDGHGRSEDFQAFFQNAVLWRGLLLTQSIMFYET